MHTGGVEIPVSQDFRWPGGRRIAVIFRMAFEAWSDDHWPGISPMGNPLKPGYPDLNARGWAEYGYRRGVFRVLDALAHHRVKATVMVCGILAERFPHIVKQIADAGHEVAAHSYTMDMKHGQPPSVYVENFKEWLQYARKREQGACKIDPAVHAHVFGRSAGMWALERVMEIARKSKDVWIGTRAEVAAHVRKVLF